MSMLFARPSDNIAGDAVSVTASTEATGYDVENLWDGNPAKPWKATAATGNVVWDFGSAVNVDLVALIHHNLTAGLEVRIQGNASDSWGSPSLNQQITIPAYDQDGFPVNPWIDLSSLSNSFRFWRLVVVGTNGANVAIGEVWLVSTKRTLTAGHLRYGLRQTTERPLIEHRTDYGIGTFYDLGAKIRGLSGTLYTNDTGLSEMVAWWDDCHGRAKPTLVVFDSAANSCQLVRFATMSRSDERTNRGMNTIAVSWEEVSRGLVL